jgi:hypothetical protein
MEQPPTYGVDVTSSYAMTQRKDRSGSTAELKEMQRAATTAKAKVVASPGSRQRI